MTTKVDLQAIAETHDRPFLITDDANRIVAANRAFLAAYGASLDAILGRTCHEVTHGNARRCDELGEECPHQVIRETGAPHTCLHVHTHYDRGRHVHHVRVKGFPLRFEDGERYFAELFEELGVQSETSDDDKLMAGASKTFLASLEAMKLAARAEAPVLIQGETGTGKELAAHFVHRNSPRAKGPFLTPALAALMLERSQRPGEPAATLAEDAMEVLIAHDYPGNVRELRNILQAAAAAGGARIGRDVIERIIGSRPMFMVDSRTADGARFAAPAVAPPTPDPAKADSLEQVERAHLRRLLSAHDGKLPAVADALGVSLRTVYRKLKRYELR